MRAVESIRDLDHIVFKISKSTWSDTGEDFFRSLVRQLSETLEADLVVVGALMPSGQSVRSLAVHALDHQIPPFEYALKGTPCGDVVHNQALCTFPDGVHRLFPADAMLVRMQAEGYVGSPLVNSHGACLGLICAVTRQPLANPRLAEAVLQIFSVRASAELERQQFQEALTQAEQRWRSFVAHGNEAIIRVALEQPISLQASEDDKIEHSYRYGFVADANDQAAVLFGLPSAPDLIGARFETISPRCRQRTDRTSPRVQPRRLPVLPSGEEIRLPHHLDDARRHCRRWKSLRSAWITGRDISALKEAEAQVRNLNRELERRVEELTELRARLEQDNAYLREEIRADHPIDEMIGSSPRFLELVSHIQLVASTSATVLIHGESGTGKELVVRAIHNLSERRQRPLVKINCAAISAGLVESELFGHVKGAFTGRHRAAHRPIRICQRRHAFPG